MERGKKILKFLTGAVTLAVGIIKITSNTTSHASDDLGCDWFCDRCNGYLNDQPGFTTVSGTWTCKECGALNDVSMSNIVPEGSEEYSPHILED